MLTKPANHPVSAHVVRKFNDYLEDEGGSVAIFIVIAFVLILMLGGIAVDVMRFETRRVALQETLDRAVLAAANMVLDESVKPKAVVDDWFAKAGLGNEFTVDYSAPVAGGEATKSSREAYARANVRSYNHFMQILDYPYFQSDAVSVAQQGVSKIEVFLVLDVTGSMSQASGSTTKIAALRDAAEKFVQVLKFNKNPATGVYDVDTKDPKDLISIGMVPYSSNVNIPVELRQQFNVAHLSAWNYLPNKGIPDLNCMEIPESTFASVALSTDDPIPMAAVARISKNDPAVAVTSVTDSTEGGIVDLGRASKPSETNYFSDGNMCHLSANVGANLLRLPSTETDGIISQIKDLRPAGNTSIALGMRWATAMIDQSARDIYDDLVTDSKMAGRPANNNAVDTRKIIVLMTDGDHVSSRHILDAFKSGPSPIWRGDDGNLAIRFDDSGVGLVGGTRPGIAPTGNPRNSCSGWSLADTVVNGNTVKRNFFVPHLKPTRVKQRLGGDAEGAGRGDEIRGACEPLAWRSAGPGGAPSWTGSGAVRQLDWSEVWRYASVDWVIRNLFLRSNVANATSYETLYNQMVGNYLTSDTYMDGLLKQNCDAAKSPAAGIEIYGIVLGNNVNEAPVKNCASAGTGYYHKVTSADNLVSTFEQIAILISELKLTQ